MHSNLVFGYVLIFKDKSREWGHPVHENVPSPGVLLSTRCPPWPLAAPCSKMHHRELLNTRRDSGQIQFTF